MKNLLRSLSILFLFLLTATPVRADDSPFKVEVFTDQSSVKSGMMFLAQVKVTNQTDGSVELWTHSCSFEKHWIVDGTNVFIQSWTCNEDHLEHMTLEAGAGYEKNIILYISKKDGSGPVTFRLGFKRVLENGDEMEPVWSDPVTMEVKLPDGAVAAPSTGDQPQDLPGGIEVSSSMPDDYAEDDEPDSGTSVEVSPKVR